MSSCLPWTKAYVTLVLEYLKRSILGGRPHYGRTITKPITSWSIGDKEPPFLKRIHLDLEMNLDTQT